MADAGEWGAQYRLLSEAEWEYAARAGSETAYSWGNEIGENRVDWRPGQIFGDSLSVGSFGANAFGLHDVHGNVSEWVEDCWNASYAGAPADGTAWEQGDCGRRGLRGGSWADGDDPRSLRSAARDWYATGDDHYSIGFRVARSLTP